MKRDELDTEIVDQALMRIKAGVADRLNKHGNGAFAGKHEAVGILAEEYAELVEAIRRDDDPAWFVRECEDIGVAAALAMASMMQRGQS